MGLTTLDVVGASIERLERREWQLASCRRELASDSEEMTRVHRRVQTLEVKLSKMERGLPTSPLTHDDGVLVNPGMVATAVEHEVSDVTISPSQLLLQPISPAAERASEYF